MSCVVIKKEFDYHTENENSQLQPTPLANTYNKAIKKTTRKFAEMTIAFTYHSLFDSNKIFINKEKPKFVKVKQFDSLEIDKIENVINKSFNLSYIINNEIKTVFLSKDVANSHMLTETISASFDIINIEKGINERGGVKMTEKLLKTRDQIENAGVYLGFVLAFVTFLLPLFTPIPLNAIIPGTLMFLSLPIFVYIRKWVRRDDK
jgi:hypothetical protein